MQLTSAARNRLANSYVSLRRSDAYRMTVRQLEALIRLSEATARIYLESQVFEVFGGWLACISYIFSFASLKKIL